jgi:hypothetical protein
MDILERLSDYRSAQRCTSLNLPFVFLFPHGTYQIKAALITSTVQALFSMETLKLIQGVGCPSCSFVFLFRPRMEAFCSLTPPARHFLKAAIDSLADSNTGTNKKKVTCCRKMPDYDYRRGDVCIPRLSSFVRRGTNLGIVIMEEL